MVSKLIRDIVVSLLFVGVFFGTSTFASSPRNKSSGKFKTHTDSRKDVRRISSQGNTPSLLHNKKIGEEVEHNLVEVLRRFIAEENHDDVQVFLEFVQNRGLDREESTVPEILSNVCGPGIAEPQQCKLLTKAFRSEPVRANVIRALLDNGEILSDTRSAIFGMAKDIFLQLPLERQSKLLQDYRRFPDCRTFLAAVTPDTDTPPVFEMRAPRIAALGDM